MGFAERLKAARQAAGLTQQELADKAGVHQVQIARLETGAREPAWSTVVALCQALEVPCTVFLDPPAKKKARQRKKREG